MTPAEAETLTRLAHNRRVLEVGSLLGYSTVVLARAAKYVVAVDPHDGYPATDPRPTYNGFRHNLTKYGVADKVIPVVGDGRRVLPMFRPSQFSLIFIDITRHAGELIFLARQLEPRWIALHDYGLKQWPGVQEAIDELFKVRSYPMEITDTLAVLDIGSADEAYWE